MVRTVIVRTQQKQLSPPLSPALPSVPVSVSPFPSVPSLLVSAVTVFLLVSPSRFRVFPRVPFCCPASVPSVPRCARVCVCVLVPLLPVSGRHVSCALLCCALLCCAAEDLDEIGLFTACGQ